MQGDSELTLGELAPEEWTRGGVVRADEGQAWRGGRCEQRAWRAGSCWHPSDSHPILPGGE